MQDKAPEENFLTPSLFKRFEAGDIPFKEREIEDDFSIAKGSLFTPLVSDMKGTILKMLVDGLFPGDTKSIHLSSGDKPCLALIPNITQERPYFRHCLRNPKDCEYGLSAAIWVYFLELSQSSDQTLLSTAPKGGAGFYMTLENGILTVKVIESLITWSCSAPVTLEVETWNNIGFTWESYNGDLRLYVNKRLVALCSGASSMSINGMEKDPAQSLWVGCLVDGESPDPSTVIQDAKVAHPAIWYWPLQHHVLLLGDKADWFEAPQTTVPTIPPVVEQKVDYTVLVEEYQPRNWSVIPPNPFFSTADAYFPLSTKTTDLEAGEIELTSSNCRGKKTYKLKGATSYYKLRSKTTGCPSDFTQCISGFSISAWINIPSSLVSTKNQLSLFEIVENVKVVLYGDFLHIFASNGKQWRVTRLVESVVRDVDFNVGFSILNDKDGVVLGFINGLDVTTMAFNPIALEKDTKHPGIEKGDVIIGSSIKDRSAAGVTISDLVFWNKFTFNGQGHRFVGYTGTQVKLLQKAEHYWSTDSYLLLDAPCRLAFERKRKNIQDLNESPPDFKLCSIYKPRDVTPVRFIVDQNQISTAPVLSMRKVDYFMLGRNKSPQPTQRDLQWLGHCLHDPSSSACRSRGITISIWLALQSVSKTNIRYIFNSGDAGDSEVSAVLDGHGWSIFTHGALLGASVSLDEYDWSLILDSKTYKLRTWINLGVTWSSARGLKLLINGIDLNMRAPKPKTRFKEYEAPPYLLIGRFDTDDSSTWLTPAEAEAAISNPSRSAIPVFWEMAHLAFSEMTHINQFLTSREYALAFDFLGNQMIESESERLWFGERLMDPSVSDLMLASDLDIPQQSGPAAFEDPDKFSVMFYEDLRAVIIGQKTVLRLGPLNPYLCPADLVACVDGMTIGGWYALISEVDGMQHVNFSQPLVLLTANGGAMGIAMEDGGYKLVGWVGGVKCEGSSARLIRTSHHNQWFHVALSWFEGSVYLFLNGKLMTTCTNTSTPIDYGKELYKLTKLTTNETYIMISAPQHTTVGYHLAIGIVNIRNSYIDSELNIGNFMGLSRVQTSYFEEASFYWPMSGLLTNLAYDRMVFSDVTTTRDRRNVDGGAVCTTDDSSSYITLTGDYRPGGNYSNLYYSCLYSDENCEGFMLIFDLKINAMLSEEDEEYSVLKTPPEDGAVGVEITINPAQGTIKAIRRSRIATYSGWASFDSSAETYGVWLNLQIIFIRNSVIFRINDTTLVEQSMTTPRQSSLPMYEHSLFPKIIIGQGVPLCFSDLVLLENIGELNPINTFFHQVCYEGADAIFPLAGDQPCHEGHPNSATDLTKFTSRVTSSKLSSCFGRKPSICTEFTISFWMLLGSDDRKSVHDNDYMILTTGPSTYQGLSISYDNSPTPKQFTLVLRLIVGGSVYQIYAENFAEFDDWVNVGVVVASGESSDSLYMELYRNGHPMMTTSSPIVRDATLCYRVNPNPGVYFGSAVKNVANMDKVFTASGIVSTLAFWQKAAASCGTPRMSYMILMGECSANQSLAETVPCQVASNCQLSQNGVCLDNTLDNIFAMAKSAQLISSPKPILALLKVIYQVLLHGSIEEDPVELRNILWSSIILLNRLEVAREADVFELSALWPHREDIVKFLLDFLEVLFSSKYAHIWYELHGSYNHAAPQVVNALAALMEVLVNEDHPVIEITSGSNMLSAYWLADQSGNFSLSDAITIIRPAIQRMNSPNATITISSISAENASITMDMLTLPRFFMLYTNSISSEKLETVDCSMVPIDSPLLTVSVSSNGQSTSKPEFYYKINLTRENEYVEMALARRTDRMHWKAMAVKEKDEGFMEFEVLCLRSTTVFSALGNWTTENCTLVKSKLKYIVCMCSDVGSFAAAMAMKDGDISFWEAAGATSPHSYKLAKLVINLSANIISIFSLGLLLLYLARKNTLRELVDHTVIKINFAAALVGYHMCFIIFPFLEEVELGCRAVGVLIHIFASCALACQCCNITYIFRALINGRLKARLKWQILYGWLINALVVVITVAATSAVDYGSGLMCLPVATSSYVAIAHTGLILLISVTVIVILLCNSDTPAYLNPRVVESLLTDMHKSTATLLYSLGVFGLAMVFIWMNPPYVGFIFWKLNGFAGCFISLALGLFDKSNVVKKRKTSEITEIPHLLGSSVNMSGDVGEDQTMPFGVFDGTAEGEEEEKPPPYCENEPYFSGNMQEEEEEEEEEGKNSSDDDVKDSDNEKKELD